MMADLPDKLTIETPEQIPLDFPLAGIGSRFLAAAVDTLIQFVVTMALLVAGMLAFYAPLHESRIAGVWLAALAVLALFLLHFGYFAGFEAWWNGQTPGKRHVHLRVIKDSGRPITPYEAVARNLLRIVDGLPALYGIGIVSMLLSAQNRRLGDFVAGTVVVHEQPLERQAGVNLTSAPAGAAAAYDVSKLTAEEFQLIEAFLQRRIQLAADLRGRMARQIALRLADKLQIPAEQRTNAEALLERLAGDYRNHAQFR